MVDKKKCCGCSACVNVCPNNCIDMVSDQEGFLYPVIDKSRCIGCGLCEKVCPALKKGKEQTGISAYACKNKDNDIKMKSSSGGAFSVFAEYVLEQGGVVFGAIFDEDFKVIHSYVDNKNDLYKMRGSKYVQSDIQNSYQKVKEILDLEKLVLFSGTSCQIAGLRSYLRKDYEKLICIDVICHGVPSPLVFKKYIKERKEQYGEDIKKISFRDKTEGWANFSFKIDFDTKTYRKTVADDEYLRGFVLNMFLRPSCYECNYKGFTCGSDISLADFWGIRSILPGFFDKNGVSLVLINSDVGRKVFKKIENKMEVVNTTLENAILSNKAITDSPKNNNKRRLFFKNIEKNNIIDLIYKCMSSNIINKINMQIKKVISYKEKKK